MHTSRLEKDKKVQDNVIKDIRNLFRQKVIVSNVDYTVNKNIINLVGLKKEIEAVKDRLIRDTRNLFEHEEKDYYKPVRVGNFWSSSFIEYESAGDKNKTI